MLIKGMFFIRDHKRFSSEADLGYIEHLCRRVKIGLTGFTQPKIVLNVDLTFKFSLSLKLITVLLSYAAV